MIAATKKVLKLLAKYFGIKLIKDRSKDWRLHLYREVNKPEIPTYINIGAGGFYHPYWTNIDKENKFYKSLQNNSTYISYDLCSMLPLPFEDCSVKIFYTSHTIEHLPDNMVLHLFDEINRCLRPGGLFRVTCPDMEIQYRAYERNDQYFWKQPSPWNTNIENIEERFLENFATALIEIHSDAGKKIDSVSFSGERLKEYFNQNTMGDFFEKIIKKIPPNTNSWLPEGHINWFTNDKIIEILRNSGFKNIYRSGYGQSVDPKLRNTDMFDSTCPELSLYIEAEK